MAGVRGCMAPSVNGLVTTVHASRQKRPADEGEERRQSHDGPRDVKQGVDVERRSKWLMVCGCVVAERRCYWLLAIAFWLSGLLAHG